MLPLMPLALIFLLVVFLEIAGFVAMAELVGLLGVFALVVLGIFAGGFIIRTIGLASVRRMQERADQGETIGQELGGLVLGFLGGVLLIIPGFLTDLIGIALLIKPIQMLVWPRYGRQMASTMPDMRQGGAWQSPNRGRTQHSETIVIVDADSEPADASGDGTAQATGPRAQSLGQLDRKTACQRPTVAGHRLPLGSQSGSHRPAFRGRSIRHTEKPLHYSRNEQLHGKQDRT
jgi:UPF0716 protein FxsA